MDRATLKAQAKEHIKGNLVVLFLITLITAVAGGICGAIPAVGSILSVVVGSALSIATVHIYLLQSKGVKPEVKELFAHFGEFWPALKVNLLVGVYTFLWSLLLIVPGIIKAISYSQSMYILAENPGIGAREALKRSKEMMEGHKMEFFMLGLSFFGWGVLTVITFGIAAIYVLPYMNATCVNFYHSINPNPVVYAPVESAPAEPVKPQNSVNDLLD